MVDVNTVSTHNDSMAGVTEKSERIVVDEIFDEKTARVLRAVFQPSEENRELFSIIHWGDEDEDVVDVWRIEAFVGFPSTRRLKEGDVFYIRDGSRLNNKYKPIPRERARQEHLLIGWEEGNKIARDEIKKQFYKLAATQMATGKRDRDLLIKQVEKKFTEEPKSSK